MKKLFTLLLLALSASVYGQDGDYIIKNNGDTVYCEIEAKRGKVFTTIDDEKITFSPSDIKGYSYKNKNYIPGPGGFIELIFEGKMILGVTYVQNTTSAGGSISVNQTPIYHVRLASEPSNTFTKLGYTWRNDLKKLGADCSNFDVEIDNYKLNDLTRKTITHLVTIYNECQLPESEKTSSTNDRLKIYVYKTYDDYKRKKGNYIGILNGYTDGVVKTTLLYVQEGERVNKELPLTGFWGFEIDTCLFRVNSKLPVAVMKQKDLVFYFDGHAYISGLLNNRERYGSNEKDGVFYSLDLKSAIEPLDQLSDGASKYAELIKCVQDGKKIQVIGLSEMQRTIEQNRRNGRYCACVEEY